jgi:hypothetical protein
MRDPSVHVKRSDLLKILSDYGINHRDMPGIMLAASKKALKFRANLTLPAKTRKKAERVLEAGDELVEEFNRAYVTVMAENNIKVLAIHKNNTQYLTLKEITQSAREFCTLFELDPQQGFLMYVRMGVKLLNKKYSLYRLKSVSDRIVDRYRTTLTINNDQSPINTELMYQAWGKAVKKYFNAVIEIERGAIDKYVHFVYAKQDADSVNANYNDWMDAQFEKWSFLQSMPEFSQLHGDNAKINYKVYISKGSTGSSTEQTYFNNLKHGKKIKTKEAIPTRIINQKGVQPGVPGDGSERA